MKQGVVVFIEGETELELYQKLIRHLHGCTTNGRFKIDTLEIRNLKGIGNYKNRARRVFLKEICVKHPNTAFTIVLCYDTDVFEFASKPPINWSEVEKDLIQIGAKKVVHVKAKRSIEDWLLLDTQGIVKYLKLTNAVTICNGNGLKTIQSLFKKAGKVYVKGSSVKGFVDALNVSIIMASVCTELKGMCRALGIKCTSTTNLCTSTTNKRKKS